MELNKKYYIELEVVTPLSVGAGNDEEWVKGVDYIVSDGKVYVIDLHKLAVAGIDLERLSALFLKNDNDGIVKLIGNKIEEVSTYIYDCPCNSDNNIKAFQRSQLHNSPQVAGSSLKGAIRSILFSHLASEEEKQRFRDPREKSKPDDEIFGTLKNKNVFMRFLKVGDFEMPSVKLYNTKIFNLQGYGYNWQGGWKHSGGKRSKTDRRFSPTGFNTLYECAIPGSKGYGTIALASVAYNMQGSLQARANHADKKSKIVNGDIKDLFAIINKHTKEYLEKEREFFATYQAEHSEYIEECIDDLLQMIPADNSYCLLKMSAGSGFHSITGDWKYNDYDRTGIWQKTGKKRYKSRKIVIDGKKFSLMGFVKLRDVDLEDYEAYRDSDK